jgi:NADPH:quinone reductase-like Zn-dependent oxidoreductase
MLEFFNDGLRPVIDEVFALDDAAAAAQRLAESRQFGKIVLRVE